MVFATLHLASTSLEGVQGTRDLQKILSLIPMPMLCHVSPQPSHTGLDLKDLNASALLHCGHSGIDARPWRRQNATGKKREVDP
jgi:hypothetical protein